MSFENAPVSKGGVEACWSGVRPGLPTRVSGLMVWLAVASVLSGIFDIKYYFHLQVCFTRIALRPAGTFSFCTARATHFGSSSSALFHRIGHRAPETLTFTTI